MQEAIGPVAGAIWTDPPPTPDSESVAFTTTPVGSPGFWGSKLIDGGASSMCTAVELLVVFGWP